MLALRRRTNTPSQSNTQHSKLLSKYWPGSLIDFPLLAAPSTGYGGDARVGPALTKTVKYQIRYPRLFALVCFIKYTRRRDCKSQNKSPLNNSELNHDSYFFITTNSRVTDLS